jgi:shikimate kinase
MRQHIALVGFMASGKSTIGKRLARKLKCAFFDTDDLVVKEHGAISDIFYSEGESAFREYEYGALGHVVAEGSPGIIACGGGVMSYEPSRKLLKKRAYRIFIKVTPEQVLERLRKSRTVRPLLGPVPTLSRIKQLYTKRMPQYAHADYVLEADGMTSAQVVDAIVDWMHKKGIEF